MNRVVSFTVLGPPSGKARPRTVRVKSGKSVTYSPDPGWFQYNVRKQAQEAGLTPTGGPVLVKVTVERRMPKSWSNKKRQRMNHQYCVATPDGVNVEASCWDALESIAFENDRQVVASNFHRFWSIRDATTITVEYMQGC